MYIVRVSCSEPGCDEEFEVVVSDLDEVEAIVCECEYSVVVLAVAEFEPHHLAVA